ncbi:MAG: hypothetical protein ACD_37C00012G0002 [uncultured bacterium]|nr:MAG: hypothetical protein ACD_37C00012G0002 [uncultured bacterium]
MPPKNLELYNKALNLRLSGKSLIRFIKKSAYQKVHYQVGFQIKTGHRE